LGKTYLRQSLNVFFPNLRERFKGEDADKNRQGEDREYRT